MKNTTDNTERKETKMSIAAIAAAKRIIGIMFDGREINRGDWMRLATKRANAPEDVKLVIEKELRRHGFNPSIAMNP